MKKNKNKQLLYLIGGGMLAVVIGLSMAAGGTLFQGNLDLDRFAAPEQSQKTTILVPTNQIRLGEMPFLKMSMQTEPGSTLQKMKINLNLNDVVISNIRLYRNEQEITRLLSKKTREILQNRLNAQEKTVARILTLEFDKPLSPEQATDVYELRLNTDYITNDSNIRSNVIDTVASVGGRDVVVRGPEEITNLEVTYVPVGTRN
jgi:hypothetical protein